MEVIMLIKLILKQATSLRHRRQTALALSDLNDQQLKDIGLSRYDVRSSRHPFWSRTGEWS
ncbi:MAG: DUF1127 domain-containing protein [Ahrensia sp.]|nr:DUF1127 domain-containing protein [Ahrensia sp.]